jgi:hypothetical protein
MHNRGRAVQRDSTNRCCQYAPTCRCWPRWAGTIPQRAGYRAELAVGIFAVVVLIAYVVMLGSVQPRSPQDDVAVGPAAPIGVPIPPVARDVYLVPFGDFPRADAEALVAHYREKFDLTIAVLPSIPVRPRDPPAGE